MRRRNDPKVVGGQWKRPSTALYVYFNKVCSNKDVDDTGGELKISRNDCAPARICDFFPEQLPRNDKRMKIVANSSCP